jgi:peptidoglycan hydrolase-like protein with peptidoglycan-binding domain
MKRLFAVFFTVALLAMAAIAQESTASGPSAGTKSAPKVFRATKEQIKEVQAKLKAGKMYAGEESGKLDDATRSSIKQWQGGNGLKQTGTLNRATLEKMGVELTETQKLVPASQNSYAAADSKTKETTSTEKPKRTIFRATKDQIAEAQKKLKAGNMYSGEESGKLDDSTRDGLKKYQEANGLKVTGTLNQVTLEKMGIELTDKQKASTAATPSK